MCDLRIILDRVWITMIQCNDFHAADSPEQLLWKNAILLNAVMVLRNELCEYLDDDLDDWDDDEDDFVGNFVEDEDDDEDDGYIGPESFPSFLLPNESANCDLLFGQVDQGG